MDPTRFSCPHCQQVLRSSRPVPPGQKFKCPKCGKMFSLPAEKPAEKADVDEKRAQNAEAPGEKSVQTYGFVEEPTRPSPSPVVTQSKPKKTVPKAEVDNGESGDMDDQEENDRPRHKLRRKSRTAKLDEEDSDNLHEDEE